MGAKLAGDMDTASGLLPASLARHVYPRGPSYKRTGKFTRAEWPRLAGFQPRHLCGHRMDPCSFACKIPPPPCNCYEGRAAQGNASSVSRIKFVSTHGGTPEIFSCDCALQCFSAA